MKNQATKNSSLDKEESLREELKQLHSNRLKTKAMRLINLKIYNKSLINKYG